MRHFWMTRHFLLLVSAISLAESNCGNSVSTPSTDGAARSDAPTTTGGAFGGSSGSGGSQNSGGTVGAGGTTSVGGTGGNAIGGTTSTGTSAGAASGGAAGSGGIATSRTSGNASGGAAGGTSAGSGGTARGGRSGSGGAAGTGGADASGGAIGTGGTNVAGGMIATGGRSGGGGAAGRGGANASGGAIGTGGTSAAGGMIAMGGSTAIGGAASTGGNTPSSGAGPAGTGAMPAGWLYTSSGKIYVANGSGAGTQWMGRGVNIDDLFLCGYNSGLSNSSAETDLEGIVSTLMKNWKPNFIRTSLHMDNTVDSWGGTTSWSNAKYGPPMTNVVNYIGTTYPNTYVLVSLRSDASMANEDSNDASWIPTAATNAVYEAIVDSFANDNFVMIGLTNEPSTASWSSLYSAMSGAVTAIRNEENKLGVPHHIIAVQGINYTSDISYYATTPIASDNIVYEYHGYAPNPSDYTYSNIPVIIGEFGPADFSDNETLPASFYTDVETKKIPWLAWDFEPCSDCGPDLLVVNNSSSDTSLSTWGKQVMPIVLNPP